MSAGAAVALHVQGRGSTKKEEAEAEGWHSEGLTLEKETKKQV